MTIARERQVHLESTPYYHCMARCVRRAFLCGDDVLTGKNFDHRKLWIVDKLKQLAGVFAIDICAYAVMSNHYHVVLRVDAEKAKQWSSIEVIERWCQLFNGNVLIERYRQGELVSQAEFLKVEEIVATWRQRLMDISWFMRMMNESIAREANAEDQCKGRFWEGRFKSQALLDEAALLTCMMYVDLNPVRAGINKTLETSDFTSIQERIHALAAKTRSTKKTSAAQKIVTDNQTKTTIEPAPLLAFGGNEHIDNNPNAIPFALKNYLELIDWTGRAIRDDKKGAIPNHLAPILQRLNINEDEWLNNVKYFGLRFKRVIGSIERIRRYSENLGVKWCHGVGICTRLYCRTVLSS